MLAELLDGKKWAKVVGPPTETADDINTLGNHNRLQSSRNMRTRVEKGNRHAFMLQTTRAPKKRD